VDRNDSDDIDDANAGNFTALGPPKLSLGVGEIDVQRRRSQSTRIGTAFM